MSFFSVFASQSVLDKRNKWKLIMDETSKVKGRKIELLAPAGDLEKLEMAVIYGADAVYIGGEEYGLRASAGNFSDEDMEKGVRFAHNRGRKVYVTMNIIPHDEDFKDMDRYVRFIREIGADAVIVSDPGVFSVVREASPDMEIHLSTQSGNTNLRSVEYWQKQGVKRIILARELSLNEIRHINDDLDLKYASKAADTEIFVHGSMCISYSGRCLLSSYLAGRDPNRGMCAHPCRWKYNLTEETRPGVYLPVFENERGTFIFNSKDLCMLPYIPELAASGVAAFKIEGRMKSSYYVATVVKSYREEIDRYEAGPDTYVFNKSQMGEISKASHREYTTGFFFGKTGENDQVYDTASYIREYDFIGIVEDYDSRTGIAKVQQRNRMAEGDIVEVVNPSGGYCIQTLRDMRDADMNRIDVAPHPQMIVNMPLDCVAGKYSILRRKTSS